MLSSTMVYMLVTSIVMTRIVGLQTGVGLIKLNSLIITWSFLQSAKFSLDSSSDCLYTLEGFRVHLVLRKKGEDSETLPFM